MTIRGPDELVNPQELRQQVGAVLNARALRDSTSDNTDEIWEHDDLKQWASAKTSSVLSVGGQGAATKSIERFGLEMVEFLESKDHSPVYYPNVLRLDTGAEENHTRMHTTGLLRQLTMQLLQRTQPADATPLAALAKINTRDDLVAAMQRVCCATTGELYFVVDLAALKGDISEMDPWGDILSWLFQGLETDGHHGILKFVLLNGRVNLNSSPLESGQHYQVNVAPQKHLPPDAMRRMRQMQRKKEEMRKRQPENLARPCLYEFVCEKVSQEPTQQGLSEEEPNATQKPFAPRKRESIRIVVICALTLEADAVQALFDQHWDDRGLPFERAPGDTNTYSVGAIGYHNILLLHMPGMGKVEAARAAATCRASFPNIHLALLVGICGGVPFGEGEMILGDVVVSDGVVQYDFGRQLPGNFVRKNTLIDNLSRPNSEIRGLLSKLKGLRGREVLGQQIADGLKILRRNAGLSASYPGGDRDILFEPMYDHVGEGTCEEVGCSGHLVTRVRLQQGQTTPIVHFGLVASGDKVIKSAADRDEIATAEGVIGFEMEGAGIWDTFPCVVIKGVCDYADSHKTKSWQRYAAATAAACMKGFLTNVSRWSS